MQWGSASQWQAWLALPAQVAARTASQTEFEGQPAGRALATDSAAFQNWIGQAGYQSPLAQWQGQVLKQLGPYAAAVENSSRKPQILTSTAPLEGTTPTGSGAPLDLSLATARSGGFVPQSAFVPVTLPESSGGQIGFQQPGPEPGFSVAFAPASSTAAGEQQGGTVFYPNIGGVSSDTDVVANAVPDGAEVTYLLRSARSPQTQTLAFSLPQGWSLAPSSVNSSDVAILSPDGSTEAVVMAPIATDAQGQNVPVSYTVHGGDTLQLTIRDQGGSYAFPIQVDPTINEGSVYTFDGWNYYASSSSIQRLDGNYGDPMEGWSFGAGDKYGTNAQGNYTLNAGPSNAYINLFELDGVYNYPDSSNPGDTAFDGGVQPSGGGIGVYVAGSWSSEPSGNSGTQYAWRRYSGSISNNDYTFTPSGTNGKIAEFDLLATESATQGSPAAQDWAEQSTVASQDNEVAPSVQVVTPPQWVNNT